MESSILVLLLLFIAFSISVQGQSTRIGFYSRSCPQAEFIIRSTVQKHYKSNPAIAPGLLRMIFHDCFVRGCDASILINGPNTEKTTPPNGRLVGVEVIDDAKAQLEAACPRTVSCADIIALASRDAVKLANGPTWKVPAGRLDGRISIASEAFNLPSFRDSIDVQKKKFSDLGLNTQDLVTLVGGHTIGSSTCQLFRYRLYNFTTIGNGADPTINPKFLAQLRALCPQNGDGSKLVPLDTVSVNRFDTSYFTNLKNGKGVLESDQKLWTDASTKTLVQRFLGVRGLQGLNFNAAFGRAMVKMTNIGLKTPAEGEIRTICSAIN